MPTIRRCCIVGCLSNSRQSPQLQFFQFPRPENPFYGLWKQACHASLSRILPFKKPVVCALHFHPNLIGGRRLTNSAVPSLRLDVPNDLKAVEQQAMVEEIERSRKCAYINAVVYEWLVRANLNPQLRGSITHGMIKDKAASAGQLVGSTSFIADNRWLNRFRETHLTGFAQKLASNQLKPIGLSLWIPDIVQDLQHLFPPTSAERVAKLESLPEQYMDYMQQYGEYEEEDDQDSQGQSLKDQQNQSHFGYDAYGQPLPNYNNGSYEGYDPYYEQRQNHHNNYNSPQQLQRPNSHSPPQQLPLQQKIASPAHRNSPIQPPVKRSRPSADDINEVPNGHINNVTDLTNVCEANECAFKPIKLNGTPTPNGTNGHTPASSPKPTINGSNTTTTTTTTPETNGISKGADVEVTCYSQALEYLKPLEDFALSKENFRAIGLISQLETVLRKGENRRIAMNLKG